MHAPFPVFDGDNLRSGETPLYPAASTFDAFDVDFVLLGCDLPDDSDDGPIDDDPEHGSSSTLGPLFSCQKTTSSLSDSHSDWQPHPFAWTGIGTMDTVGATCPPPRIAVRYFSFGKLSQSGIARLRC